MQATQRTGASSSVVTFLLVLLLSLVPLLGLTACGAQPPGRPASASDHRPPSAVQSPDMAVLEALRTAHQATDAAGSAEVEATMVAGSQVSTKAHGVVGWADGLHGTLTINYTGGSMATTMRELGSASTEARFVTDAYYARMSDKFAALSNGRHWIKYDLDVSMSFVPNQSLALLLIAGDVRRAGAATVRGVDTTHYTGTVRPADPVGPGVDADRATGLREQLRQAGITGQRIDVWVDGHDRLVKRVERSQTAAGALSTTAFYSRFGAPVSVKPRPPAEDTADFNDLVLSRPAS